MQQVGDYCICRKRLPKLFCIAVSHGFLLHPEDIKMDEPDNPPPPPNENAEDMALIRRRHLVQRLFQQITIIKK